MSGLRPIGLSHRARAPGAGADPPPEPLGTVVARLAAPARPGPTRPLPPRLAGGRGRATPAPERPGAAPGTGWRSKSTARTAVSPSRTAGPANRGTLVSPGRTAFCYGRMVGYVAPRRGAARVRRAPLCR